MALLTWRERNSKGAELGPTWYLEFDATLLEEFTRSAEITRFPVETGAVLTDHYQPQPRAISLEVQVSDTPSREILPRPGLSNSTPMPTGAKFAKALDLPVNPAPVAGLAGQRVIQGNVSRFPKQRTAVLLQFNGTITRTVDAFQVLDGLMESRQLVDVLLFRDVEYKNMMIVNVRTPRGADAGSTLTFTIDLVQVQFAGVEKTTSKEPKASKHSPKRDGGRRNGSNAKATATAQAQRWGWT